MKKSRLVKIQHTRVIETGKDCGESSPYWNWVNNNPAEGSYESPLANPDQLTDSANVFPQESHHYSVGDISRKLSGQQKKVFELYVNEGLDEREIAKILKIGYNTVRTHLRRVRERFQNYA